MVLKLSSIKMDTINWIYLLVHILTMHVVYTNQSGSQEYCITETFTATCQPTEIIKITKALYGRMKIGKCVKKEMGYLGCHIDAMDLISRACSGRVTCEYPANSVDLMETHPCDELTPYLEAGYECIPVLSRPTSECSSSQPLIISDLNGYMSSYVAKESGCGSMAHPWRIEVMPGQRVNFTLHSFSSNRSERKCNSLGYIVEQGHRNNVTICSKAGGKEHIYTSNGRQLQIHLDNTAQINKVDSDILLQYKVFGCADLKVPMFAWYKRQGDEATIGCENQDLTWTLKCEGNRWSGVVGNCTENVAASMQEPAAWMGTIDLKKLTILCIVVGFVILIVIAGIVIVWKWRESSQHKPPSPVLLQEEQYRLNKGPLPPVPENSSHYRSLIRQPDPQAFPQHSQTMPRPPPQQHMQEGDDYSADWRFGTAPWQKQTQMNV